MVMSQVLFSWIGKTDLQAASGDVAAGDGPVGQAALQRRFSRIVLISDWPTDDTNRYLGWLRQRTATPVELVVRELPEGPMDFGRIYEAASSVVREALREDRFTRPVFHLSPGSSAMAAVWILLGKTLYDAELIASSPTHGVRTAVVPFDISADFLPELWRAQDERFERAAAGEPRVAAGFEDIVARSPAMLRIIALARRVAPRSLTILIEGESGTGKELLARAIHRASPRYAGPFVAVNCAAIPLELAESELFGHRRGSFSGAVSDRRGHFEAANGGTIFLDEIGDLPLAVQVKLLRVLQEREVVPIGESKPRSIDVRVIAATNRSLIGEVKEGRFREDLFYRLAVAVLTLPPLRDRQSDTSFLIDHILERSNAEGAKELGFAPKSLAAGARNLLLRHQWPGNVRELENTIRRAVLWSPEPVIGTEDIATAILPVPTRGADSQILDLPLGPSFNIGALLARVARHYLERALHQARGNKSQAAELVGLSSHQTFTNWMKRYDLST
jgi:DNA-binding NtrC family response regulator